MITCSNISISKHGDTCVMAATIDGEGLPEALCVEVPASNAESITKDNADWAALMLLVPAMLLGRDITFNAPISGQLLAALRTDIQSVLRITDPRLKHIQIFAPDMVAQSPSGAGVGTGFSAGVDSFATLELYGTDKTPKDVRVSHLTIFDVGAIGHTSRRTKLFDQYLERCQSFASKTGLETLALRANIDSFFDAAAGASPEKFRTSHTVRNAAAAMVFQPVLRHYLYSSGIPYPKIRVAESRDFAAVDPVLLPLLNTAEITFHSAGAALSRVEKTEAIAHRKDAQSMLDVCVTDPEKRLSSKYINCGKCFKCTRTLLTLEALNQKDAFSGVFDMDEYEKHRNTLLRLMAVRGINGDTNDAEAFAFAETSGVELPWFPKPLRHAAAFVKSRLSGEMLWKINKAVVGGRT